MLGVVARLLMTMTSIAPVGFVYAWVSFWQCREIAEDKPEYKACSIYGLDTWVIFSATCLALVILCILLMLYAEKKLPVYNVNLESVEAADREGLAFMLIYLLPLFTDSFIGLKWEVWIPTLLIFGIITATGHSYHFNPLLNIFGWHFYKGTCSSGVTYVVITRRTLRNLTGVLKLSHLTEYILIEERRL